MAISDSDIDTATADIPITRDAREALERAAGASRERGLTSIDPVEVLRAVLAKPGGLAEEAVRAQNLDPAALAASLKSDGTPAPLPLRQLLVNANREAQVLGHYRVDPVHLLLALMYSDSRSTSVALHRAGLTLYDLRRHVQTGVGPDTPVAGKPVTGHQPDRALRRRPLPRLRGVLGVSPIFLALMAIVAGSGALLWLRILPQDEDALILVFVTSAWIASVCVHEFSHALVAYVGGDRSMAISGYLTFDPLRYTNILMSIVLPIVALLLGGFGLPGGAVYIDTAALRSKWWVSAVSAAGPIGTILCGLVAAGLWVLAWDLRWINSNNLGFFEALALVVFLEAFALIINLLPIPPLDGFGIIRPWLPYSLQATAMRLSMAGIVLVFVVLWYVPGASDTLWNAVTTVSSTAGVDPVFAFAGQQHMRFEDLRNQ